MKHRALNGGKEKGMASRGRSVLARASSVAFWVVIFILLLSEGFEPVSKMV